MVVNAEWYFWSHRLALANALRAAGLEVIIAAAVERGYDQAIRQAGFTFVPLHLQRRSTKVSGEISSLIELFRLYRDLQPDLVHHFTIKPVIYGSLAARAARVLHIVNTIPGLGYTFLANTWRRRLVRRGVSLAYRLALNSSRIRVIFQNPEDCAYFIDHKLVMMQQAIVIRGSGVDVAAFSPTPEPAGVPIVLLASRLLWDKGIGEFVDAARTLRDAGVSARFVIVGLPDAENPNSVPESILQRWSNAGLIEWWGLRNDMPAVLQQATVVTLPSYYPEGVPKILLEAAATERAIVTTDTPGCREIVQHDVTGILVRPQASHELAAAIQTLLDSQELRRQLGSAARRLVEQEFAEGHIIAQTMDVYRELLALPLETDQVQR
jgi:glycosyltransferase involved in cell wall biosynthesis